MLLDAVEIDAAPLLPAQIKSECKVSVGELDIYMSSLAIDFADERRAAALQAERQRNAERRAARIAEFASMESAYANAQKHRRSVETSMIRELNQADALREHARAVAADNASMSASMASARGAAPATARSGGGGSGAGALTARGFGASATSARGTRLVDFSAACSAVTIAGGGVAPPVDKAVRLIVCLIVLKLILFC